MKNSFWLLVFFSWFAFGCKEKKPVLTGDGPQNVKEFIGSFEDIKLPFSIEDTAVGKKKTDSVKIAQTVLSRFLPDTVFRATFAKSEKVTVYPIGKISVKDKETYLLVKALTPKRQTAYVLVFTEKDSFSVSMPLLTGERMTGTGYSAAIDKRYTISRTKLRRQSAGDFIYTKEAYVYNSAGVFTLILTESNDVAKANATVINPIDTLPAKHKWSGDYRQDKKNFVSVRDGSSEKEAYVFIHFEKSDGECIGELKGRVQFTSANTARYTESGDPCVLELQFSGNTVSLKEEKGCGAYRGIKCFFEGRYTRKKVQRKK